MGDNYRATGVPTTTIPPTISPDNSRIAYLLGVGGAAYTFDAESFAGDPTNHLACYSPDGTAIVFSSMRGGGNEHLWTLQLATPPPPPDNVLSLGGGSGISGTGTITIPVSFTSNVASPALEFQITDTPDWVEAVGVTPRGRASALTTAFSDQGNTHIVMYGANGGVIVPGTGQILDLELTVKPEAVLHDSTVLTVGNIVMSDQSGHAISVSSQGSVIHIERKAGDINGDNEVDAGDLVRLVEIILGTGAPPTSDELAAADCNNDAARNALDITCALGNVLSKPAFSERSRTAATERALFGRG